MSEGTTEKGNEDQLQIYEMRNPIQNYAWGSRTAIANLMGVNEPSDQPQAEMWMGAHPKAPSSIRYQGAWHQLDHLIGRHAESFIGADAMNRFGTQLPFLLKILAVSQPLSIQAHPNPIQAKRGFELENKKKIELNAGNRNYKDDRHKPECICALTPFWGLCGFRSDL
jgi:mannose-6-phosphate isomerase